MINVNVTRRIAFRWIGGIFMSATFWGCSGADTTGVLPLLTTNPYASLRLNVRGAVMSTVAPYDTLQLAATPYDGNGTPLVGAGTVTYTASDTNVRVSATGLVTAHGTTNGSYVIARLQDQALNLTHADTAYVTVTKLAGPSASLATFSIHLPSSDSAKVDIPGFFLTTKPIPVTATDRAGNVIPAAQLLVHFTSTNAGLATVTSKAGVVTGVTPGIVSILASTTYYGVTLSDSIQLVVGYADAEQVFALLFYPDSSPQGMKLYKTAFGGNGVVIGVGGSVIFTPGNTHDYSRGDSVSFVFDDSASAQASPLLGSATFAMNGAGNISPYGVPSTALSKAATPDPTTGLYQGTLNTTVCKQAPYPCAFMRSFSKAGVYYVHYYSLSNPAFPIYVMTNPTLNP